MSKQNDYWKKREEEAQKHYLKTEEEYNKRLKEIYQNMIDSADTQINAFYSKYAKNGKMTLADAKKAVSDADIKALSRKAKKYVEEKDFSKAANEEMKLYNTTMKINRLEYLKSQIGIEMVDGFNRLDSELGKDLTERVTEEFKRQAGILGEMVGDVSTNAKSIVNASFKNATFSDRIWMYQDIMKSNLDVLLQRGLIAGDGAAKLASTLRKSFKVSQRDAERLMVTELARVQTEAQKKSLEANGYDEYEFIGGQADACDICSSLNGKHWPVEKMAPGTNAPPMHPNCRCSVAAYMDRKKFDAFLSRDKNGHMAATDNTNDWSGTAEKKYTKEELVPDHAGADQRRIYQRIL